ncbi:hypothetical protein ACFQ3S_14135 [Mucilaginibacter terrae]|uniref:hypothetical protein n=1 Tax=Mucilaginibacter terrae TaxID=1955052 RepID=UPI00363E770C
MKPSRFKTLFVGLFSALIYAFITLAIVTLTEKNVSIAYIFILPLILGAIPVLFSTKEQLKSYKSYLIKPWIIIGSFFYISFFHEFEGMICLVIIIGPFILLGSLGAFIFRLIKLKQTGNQTSLYSSLLLPFIVLIIEGFFPATNQYYNVSTSIMVKANQAKVWENIKNVKNIKSNEIEAHFIHLIGIPKPLNGQLDHEGVGGIRSITWEKGIRFNEVINQWREGKGFAYAIKINPTSIPPTTLDEHVMIGGRYFDMVNGSYAITPLGKGQMKITLECKYRITTNLNFYSRWWADYILNDFNEMILEVIKKRCEKPASN